MPPRLAVRALLLLLVTLAVWVTWRINSFDRSLEKQLSKGDIEAAIAAGGGQVLQPAKPFNNSFIDVVMFGAPGCALPFYVKPGTPNNGIFYYLRANTRIEQDAYGIAMAYRDYLGAPLSDFTLRYLWFKSDIGHFFGRPPVRNAGNALFFLVPNGCEVSRGIAWQSLWVTAGQ